MERTTLQRERGLRVAVSSTWPKISSSMGVALTAADPAYRQLSDAGRRGEYAVGHHRVVVDVQVQE